MNWRFSRIIWSNRYRLFVKESDNKIYGKFKKNTNIIPPIPHPTSHSENEFEFDHHFFDLFLYIKMQTRFKILHSMD